MDTIMIYVILFYLFLFNGIFSFSSPLHPLASIAEVLPSFKVIQGRETVHAH